MHMGGTLPDSSRQAGEIGAVERRAHVGCQELPSFGSTARPRAVHRRVGIPAQGRDEVATF
jgi:hypothetical protein